MAREGLFGGLAETPAVKARDEGKPRMRSPVRDQLELQAGDLGSLVDAEHPVRVSWVYVAQLDLSALEGKIAAREHTPGRAPAMQHLWLALWRYATADGVGSARAVARLCETHHAYRWLCGGVSVNYHGLADFRPAHPDLLDELLTQSVAGLAIAGVVNLDEVVQDGVRVRAAAGAGSYRRKTNLHKELRKARRLIDRLKQETDDDPDASNRRIKAAGERAAREREARVAKAVAAMAELQAQRERRVETTQEEGAEPQEPRAPPTPSHARGMKMAHRGSPPPHNLQDAD